MSSDLHKQPSVPARCDLCGRETPGPKAYRLLSRVVPLPDKRVSLTPAETSSLTSETKFKTHDFAVCPRCHDRKMIYLVISLAMLAGWIWLAIKSDAPLFPLLGLVVILGFSAGSGRFLPVQRLARRLRREQKAVVSAASPRLRFRVETLTPAAHQLRVQGPSVKAIIKRCESCKTEVSVSSKVGDRCPHCGVLWGRESKRCDSCREEMPLSAGAGDRCRRCGARWGA
jgi:hypothetical protein